jgi:hypothetical protein
MTKNDKYASGRKWEEDAGTREGALIHTRR